MLNTININLKTDIKTDRPTSLPIKLMSQDKNNNQFILRFTNGGESVILDETYTVEVLTEFTKSGTSRLTSAVVRQDYATWEFDTAYITQDETVYNYVYVRKSGTMLVSADSNAFYFAVGLSEIDKDAGRVAEVYDENYEKVLADYSGALDERTTERLDDAVADFNQRGDVEIADWREYADVELEGYLADRVVLKNELNNGGFDSSMLHWVAAMSTATWSADFVELAPTNRYGGLAQNRTTTMYNGRVLYICGMVKAKSAEVSIVSNSNPGLVSIFHSGGGDWERLSMIQNQPTDATRIRIEVRDDAVSPIEKFQIKYVATIDLTSTFGAGNEPTKEEMDELIKITGYFDEITLTQKQVLKWQLNLMRQNRNALVALGGTII